MADWDEMAVVGRVARSHGNKGEVIVNPETDFPDERFRPGATVFTSRGGEVVPMRVARMRLQQGRPIVGFEGVASIDEAERLANLELRVPDDALEPLPAGTFYHHDLVGCAVETVGGERVGAVTEVEGAAGASRLVVTGARGDVLVPLAADICVTIDPANRRIVIDPPDGLLDLNA